MTGFSFYALGTVGPQGSKSYKGRTKTGRVIMAESSNKVAPWREAIKAAAPAVERPLDGPIAVRIVFTVPRPKSAKAAMVAPSTRPDLDKCVRSTFDGITDAGLWADDARVSDFSRLAKVWPHYDDDALPVPGVIVAAAEIRPGFAVGYELHLLFRTAQDTAISRIRGAA